MPKTGGTWLVDVLRRLHAETWRCVGPSHSPLSTIAHAAWGDRTGLGSICDPWTWYESWYLHSRAYTGYQASLRLWGGGSLDFASVLHGITRPTSVETLPRQFGVLWKLPRETDLRPSLLAGATGLWSWVVRAMFQQAHRPVLLLSRARLRPSLEDLLATTLPEPDFPM